MSFHRISLILLYLLTLAATTYLIAEGWSYYQLSLPERPHHPLHQEWKPGGLVGHGLGIVGSLLMLILLLYSLRKRVQIFQQWGNIRYWLNYHIWMGVTGPLLVIFHTSFKFGGIVSISFWSMVAVALSGVLGRYIYLQIPRSLGGQELSHHELEEMDGELQAELQAALGEQHRVLAMIQAASGEEQAARKRGFASMLFWIGQDLALPNRLRAIRQALESGAASGKTDIQAILKVARKKVKLRRRMAFLDTAQGLLHHWHVIHKPFAIVMLVIMVVHVAVTILFGSRWIF